MSQPINQDISDTYTEVPYHSDAFSQSCPENLEAVATLFGLAPAPSATARVLELGCASGGNILPYAARNPDSTCIGIDLVELQIQQGQAIVEAAQVSNLSLITLSIEDVDASFGLFDYIVCHGVYSWVPASVQDAILRICKNNLSPRGVAYISYNTYPGWKTKEIVRDAMLLRAGAGKSAQEKLGRAKGMVEFMHQRANPDSVLKAVLNEALPMLEKSGDHYLTHEYLELCNAPCYFKDFLNRADAYGLSYLAEAQPQIMFANNFGEHIAGPLLAELSHSQIELEQYLDFVVNRAFRQTLIIPSAFGSNLQYAVSHAPFESLHYAGIFEPEQTDRPGTISVRSVCNGVSLHISDTIQQAAIEALHAAYPSTLSFEQLLITTQTVTQRNVTECTEQLRRFLEFLLVSGAVRYRAQAVVAARTPSEKPVALPLERLKAQRLPLVPVRYPVSNLWHDALILDPIEHCLIAALDGTKDRDALAKHLRQSALRGQLHFLENGEIITDSGQIEHHSQINVDPALERLAHKGLLIA